jgi:hypothetical protein
MLLRRLFLKGKANAGKIFATNVTPVDLLTSVIGDALGMTGKWGTLIFVYVVCQREALRHGGCGSSQPFQAALGACPF